MYDLRRKLKPDAILFHFIFTLALVLSLTSCGKLPGYQVLSKADAFIADATINPNVDLLFVIDNSGSMEDNQTQLANSFQSFIEQFSDKGLQFHIAIITTDQYGNTTDTFEGAPIHPGSPSNNSINNWWSTGSIRYSVANTTTSVVEPILNNKYGSFLSKYADFKFLTWETDDYIGKFQNNAHLGIHGGGSEMPLLSVTTALRPAALSGWNTDFIRPGAFLSVIVVTDEDEAKQVGFAGGGGATDYLHSYPTAMNDRISLMFETLKDIKGDDLENFSFNVIAAPEDDDNCIGLVDYRGITLQEAVDQMNATFPPLGNGEPKAKFKSICNPLGFSGDLLEIGSDIIEANARYQLLQPPLDSNEITVVVNGSVVTRSSVDGWEYIPDGRYIQFYGTAVPPVGAEILIDYVPGAPL